MLKLVSKKEAIRKGIKNYFTGKKCKNGHIDIRNVRNSTCRMCKKRAINQKQLINSAQRQTQTLKNLTKLGIDRELVSKSDAINLGLKTYFTGKPCKQGHYNGFSVATECCKTCVNYKARSKRNRKPKMSEKELRAKKLLRLKAWRNKNLDKVKMYAKKYNRENRKQRTALENKRRAQKLKAIPKWANLELIKEFYINRPEEMHVDHIIPLQGKLICGFHVENNLCITATKFGRTINNLSVTYICIY